MNKVGENTRIELTITDQDVLTDPDDLVITITRPDLSTFSYTYGVDEELVRTGIGLYQVEFLLDAGGVWSYTWESTNPTKELTVQFSVEAAPLQVTFHTRDEDLVTVVGAVVSVNNSDDEYVVASGEVNASGNFIVGLVPGSYSVTVSKPGWLFPITLVSVSAPGVVNLTGEDLGIAVTREINTCRVYGYVVGLDGIPLSDATVIVDMYSTDVQAIVENAPTGVRAENVMVARHSRTLRPNEATGFWELDLVQATRVRISVPAVGWQRTFRVPSQRTLNVADARSDS